MTVASNVYDGQGNLVEQVVDHGDGTGEFLCYENGSVVETVALDGLPLPQQEIAVEVTAADAIDTAASLLVDTQPALADALSGLAVALRSV